MDIARWARLPPLGLFRRGPRSVSGDGFTFKAALLALFIGGVAVFVGLLSVMLGGLAADRPIFILALPMVLAIGFTFALSPKALLMVIITTRAGLNPIFESAQFEGAGGLGGLVNLAVIGLTLMLVLRDPRKVPAGAWWVWAPILAVEAFGIAYSPEPFNSLRLVLGHISTAAMFMAAFHFVDDFRSLDRACHLIVISSIPVTIITLNAIATGDVAHSLEGAETVSGRYSGPFSHPNILAFYAVLLIGVLLYLWKRGHDKSGALVRVVTVLYLLVQVAVLISTKTRSAWLAMMVIILIYGIIVERRFLVYLLIAPIIAMMVPEIRDRIVDLGQGNEVYQHANLNSYAWRKYIWESGLAWMEPARLGFGYGMNAFFFHSITFFPGSGGVRMGAHNVYVQMLFDLGVVGLAAYCYQLFSVCRMGWQLRRFDMKLAVITLGLIVTYIVSSASDNMLSYLVYNWYFWFAVGAFCAVARTKKIAIKNVQHG